jgi:signal transduction histidine kinase
VLLSVLASGGEARLGHAYLLLLPVIWAAMRHGLAGGVLASAFAQVGVIVAMQAGAHPDAAVVEMQLRMATISMTSLLLGVTVDERSRVDAELRRSLRMAAAGQMSAALAHEMSQPLTALAAYAQACERLAAGPEPVTPERRAMLRDVTRRIALDARRSSDVVKRLRDFFQSGATQLKACSPAELIRGEVQAHQRRADAERIRLRVEVDEGLPKVWADEVQVAVVLRNLLSNALDAVRAGGSGGGEVLVRARAEPRELMVEVIDSGPGLNTAQLQSVFEPGVTDKVWGMGVGLSICRAIIEAHEGRLWALPGPGGRFGFTLPLGQDDAPPGRA